MLLQPRLALGEHQEDGQRPALFIFLPCTSTLLVSLLACFQRSWFSVALLFPA